MNYIFDYGGTLDSNGCHWGKKIWHAYEQCNVPVSWEQYREAYIHGERTLGKNRIIMPDYTFHRLLSVKLDIQLQHLLDNTNWQPTKEELQTIHDSILSVLYTDVCATIAHSREVLTTLKQKGAQMVLVSNFYGNINAVLEEFQLSDMFETVIESAVVGIRKPDPAIFQLGVDYFQQPASTITVVGDSIDKDIIPAQSIGCRTVWIKGEAWDDAATPSEKVADKTITDLTEILDF